MIKYDTIGAIVLASGFSRRFGKENKLLQKINHRSLIEYAIDPLVDLCHWCIVSNHEKLLSKYPNNSVYNPLAAHGQSESVKRGVEHFYNKDAVIFVMGDQPCIPLKVYEQLIQQWMINTDSIVVPQVNGRNTTPTLFSKKFFLDLMNIQGDQGGRSIIKKYPNNVLYVPFSDEKVFIDIDNESDLDSLQ